MKSENYHETPATEFLEQNGVIFSCHSYHYEDHGGTRAVAEELRVGEHAVVKTLIMEDESKQPIIMLIHGDCKVSAKELARQIHRKKIAMCKPEVANRHSGYLVGGTSPFGTKKKMPVYIEKSILNLDSIFINGGKRGYQLQLPVKDLMLLLEPEIVEVAIKSD
ncbi:Cys-tRNA(Pro) deacylase [Paludibacterium yongneupense]|uniref:Cys-tRNA(Pro) deacylase n=1 Tax=Paludibacterium yongneupense TaxID=400061 RepID=UPI000491992F|nr:Cys-tRNA(Pro) deacylase [Paludibacterium yongneupense]